MRNSVSFQGQTKLNGVSLELSGDNLVVKVDDIDVNGVSDIVVELYKRSQRERYAFSAGSDERAQWVSGSRAVTVAITPKLLSAKSVHVIVFLVQQREDGSRLISAKTPPLRPASDDVSQGTSLLEVVPDDRLGGLLWRLDFLDAPVLYVLDTPERSYSNVLQDPMFAAAVLPEVVRMIAMWLPTSIEDQNPIAADWHRFLVGMGFPDAVEGLDDEQLRQYAELCAGSFATAADVLRRLVKDEEA